MLHKKRKVKINNEIQAKMVRIVSPDGKEIGIMPLSRALYIAEDLELDLVEVVPHANPPVCRIIDYGKYKYEQEKKEREQKKKQKRDEMKEMKFRISIEKHDFDIKVKHLKKFLESDHKTKINVRFRSMELAHKERGYQLLSRIEKESEEVGRVVSPPHMEGRNLIMIISPSSSSRNKKNA